MLFFICLIISLVIMVVGLLINHSIYRKNGVELVSVLQEEFGDDDLFFSTMFIMFLLIFMMIPFINVLISIALNSALFIHGVS